MCNAITKNGKQCKNTKYSSTPCLIHQKIYDKKGPYLYTYHEMLYKQHAEKNLFLNTMVTLFFRHFGNSWIKNKECIDGYAIAYLYITTKHAAQRNKYLNE